MSRAAIVVGLFAAIAVMVWPVYPHFLSPNEFSRWIVAESLIEHHSLEVTPALDRLGARMEDLSEVGGKTYSNKAPGLALLSLPGYAAARLFTDSIRTTLTAMRLTGSTIPVILLAMLFLALGRRFGADDSRIAIVLFVLLMATPLFAYGLLLFSHALVAALLFGAWAALFASSERVSKRDYLAGAAIGMAVLSDYPMAVPGAVLISCTLFAARSDKLLRLARIAAGGLPFAVVLLVYQKVAFGGWMDISSAHEANPSFNSLAGRGIFGIGMPSAITLLRLLADPARGLFVFSPVLIAGAIALVGARRRLDRAAFVALAATPLSLLLMYAGYANWQGGWTVGPRYLVAAVPFLVFPLLLRERSAVETLLAGASTAAIAITSLAFPFVPEDVPMPWGGFSLALLVRHCVAPNLGGLIGLPIALPFALIGAAAIVAYRRHALLFVGGAIVWVAFAFAIQRPSPMQRLEMAYIEEVYFQHPGAMARTFPGVQLPDGLLRRRDAELWIRIP